MGRFGDTLSAMAIGEITVNTLLREKNGSVFRVPVDATVEAAVGEMNRERVGSVLVEEEGKVVGIFTERDVLTRVVAEHRVAKETRVREVMTRDFQFISKENSVEDAMQRMTDRRVRHLPVFEGERLLGMISIGDVMRWMLKIHAMEAESLKKYIFEEYPG